MMPTQLMDCFCLVFGFRVGGGCFWLVGLVFWGGAEESRGAPLRRGPAIGRVPETHEAAVQAGDAVRRHRLAVHVHEPVELALPALLARLGVVGQARARVVERVDKRERGGAGGTTGGHVAGEPLPVAVAVLVVAEHLLELVLEGKVERLRGEVADDVGRVAAPQGAEALVADGAAEAVADALVGLRQAALLDHLVLVLWILKGFVGGLAGGGAQARRGQFCGGEKRERERDRCGGSGALGFFFRKRRIRRRRRGRARPPRSLFLSSAVLCSAPWSGHERQGRGGPLRARSARHRSAGGGGGRGRERRSRQP